MSQHFLLKAESRTMSLKKIFQLTDNEAFELMKSLRWNNGKPICPVCGCNEHYFIKNYKRFECKSCKKHYTVTSGTIFAYHKLPLQDYLGAIAILTNNVKSSSNLSLSRQLNVQYKTAFVLSHKIREAIMNHKDDSQLTGEVEIDGSYFGNYVRPVNRKEDRIDRRLLENKSDKERCILVLRQRGKEGANRTLTFVIRKENQNDIKNIVNQFVAKRSVIYADENSSYDLLHAKYEVKRVNHSKEYSNKKLKACTNQAESFFARMKRSQIGQHHHFSNNYIDLYAFQIAYYEDMRRVDNGSIFKDIVFRALHSSRSDRMTGYWQKRKKKYK